MSRLALTESTVIRVVEPSHSVVAPWQKNAAAQREANTTKTQYDRGISPTPLFAR